MALIPLGLDFFCRRSDTSGDNAMRHHNSVFYGLLKHVPGSVQLLGGGARGRSAGPAFDDQKPVCRLAVRSAGRSIEPARDRGGACQPSSTLGGVGAAPRDAGRRQCASPGGGVRRAVGADDGAGAPAAAPCLGRDHLSDRLDRPAAGRAQPRLGALFGQGVRRQAACGLRRRCRRPIYAALSPARVNDITAAQAMPIEPGATYVFDLGYYDYAWWKKLDDAGCRIVTRFNRNIPLAVVEESLRQGSGRRNPMADAVRAVQVKTDWGKVLRILSNDLDATAEEIADLYKRRWAIELFFRWVKQTLMITRFLGTGENAVPIQIAVALIAFSCSGWRKPASAPSPARCASPGSSAPT
jgi:hypothetical protein